MVRGGWKPPLRGSESLRRPCLCSLGFHVAIARLGIGYEGIQQLAGDDGNSLNCFIERRLVGLRRLVEARQLSYELQSRGLDFFLRRRWIKVEQGFDVSTH